MTPTRYDQLRSLFLRVAELPPNERLEVLDGMGADDASLREELESMLAHPGVATDAFRDAVLPRQDNSLGLDGASVGADPYVPDWIGHYRIVRRIAQGGMGTVFEAEQDRPRRKVAIKVLSPGLASPDRLIRFEHESQILGMLQHPFIARVLEAGSADLGCGSQPYFAMEFVDGVPLVEYAITKRLSTEERLALFLKVGEAVSYAHQHGVIHRDLKPDNILVDPEGCPKVLDFGVARITGSDLRKATLRTDMGQLIGTVPYMSPEQATGYPQNVDFRSDVYALGVVLFELLTERLPYDVEGMMIHEVVRVVREDTPLSLGSVNRRLRGDLETIMVKALEKDKQRRYQSVSDLVADVRRFQSREPILARPASGMYHLHRLIARHKAPFSGAAVLFILLIAFSGWMSTLYARAYRAEQLAQERLTEVETARDESESVIEYLESMLASANPENLGREVLVRDVLDGALTSLGRRFADKPLVEARLRLVVGDTYAALGLFEDAEPHQVAAATLRMRELGASHPMTMTSMNSLAVTLREQGKFAESGDLHRKNYEMQRRVLGEEHPDTLQSVHNLACSLLEESRFADAEELFARTLWVLRRIRGPAHKDTLETMNYLGVAIFEQGRYVEAEKLLRTTLETQRRVLGEKHPRTLRTMSNLAQLYQAQGVFAESKRLQRETLKARRQVLGDEHPRTQESINNSGNLLYGDGHYADAEAVYRDTLDTAKRTRGESHRFTLSARMNVANAKFRQGRYAEAEHSLRETLEMQRSILGNDHRDTLRSMNLLANAINRQGRVGEATKLLRETVEIMGRVHGKEHPDTLGTTSNLASMLVSQGLTSEAKEMCRQTLESRRRVLGAEHMYTLESTFLLARIFLTNEEWNKAEELFRSTIEKRSRLLGRRHPTMASPLGNLAVVLLQNGSPEEARTLIEESLAIRLKAHPKHEIGLAYARSVLGGCLTALGHYEEAEPLVVESYDRLKSIDRERSSKTTSALEHVVTLYEAWGKTDKRKKYEVMLSSVTSQDLGQPTARPQESARVDAAQMQIEPVVPD